MGFSVCHIGLRIVKNGGVLVEWALDVTQTGNRPVIANITLFGLVDKGRRRLIGIARLSFPMYAFIIHNCNRAVRM